MKNKKRLQKVIAIIIVIIIIITFSWREEITSKKVPVSEKQWYLQDDNPANSIGWKEMWEYYNSIDDKKIIKVGVIDTGVDIYNSEIAKSIESSVDESKIWDSIGHGTKIAGIICANQYQGNVAGISDCRMTRLFPIKVVDEDKVFAGDSYSCDVECLIDAIEEAERHGCRICNISLNGSQENDKLKQCMENSKMLFVVSAGNGEPYGKNIDRMQTYPASFQLENMIAVTGVKSNRRLSRKSNYGKNVDVAAPGTEIYNID